MIQTLDKTSPRKSACKGRVLNFKLVRLGWHPSSMRVPYGLSFFHSLAEKVEIKKKDGKRRKRMHHELE